MPPDLVGQKFVPDPGTSLVGKEFVPDEPEPQGPLEAVALTGESPETTAATDPLSQAVNFIANRVSAIPPAGRGEQQVAVTESAAEEAQTDLKALAGLSGETAAATTASFVASKIPFVGPALAPLVGIGADEVSRQLNEFIGLREKDPNRDVGEDLKQSLAYAYGLFVAPQFIRKIPEKLTGSAKKARMNALNVRAKDRLISLGRDNIDDFDRHYEIARQQGLFNNPFKGVGEMRKKIFSLIDDRASELNSIIKRVSPKAKPDEVTEIALAKLDKVDEWVQTIPGELRGAADEVLNAAKETLFTGKNTIERVNDLKKTYWKWSKFKGNPDVAPIANEARKLVGNALKETVEEVADQVLPDVAGSVKKLNADMGALYAFERTAKDAVAKDKGQDLVNWLTGHFNIHNRATQAGIATGVSTKNPGVGLAVREGIDVASSSAGRNVIAGGLQGAGRVLAPPLNAAGAVAANPLVQGAGIQAIQGDLGDLGAAVDRAAEITTEARDAAAKNALNALGLGPKERALAKIPKGSIPRDLTAFDAEQFSTLTDILPFSDETRESLKAAQSGTENERIFALGNAQFELRGQGLFAPSPLKNFHSFVATPDSKSSKGNERLGVIVAEPEREAYSIQLQKMKDNVKSAKLQSEFNADGSVIEIPDFLSTGKTSVDTGSDVKANTVESQGEDRVADTF